MFEPKEKPRKPKAPKETKKRKEPETVNEDEPASKAAREDNTVEDTGPVRRSARNKGKSVDYKAEQTKVSAMPIAFQAGIRQTGNDGPLGSSAGTRRTQNP